MLERLRSFGYALTGSQAEILGLWERVGDNFAGCTVMVSPHGEGLQGQITSLTPTMRQYGWGLGDLKWRRIASVSGVTFQLEDMFKELDPDTRELKRVTYQPAKIYFLSADSFSLVSLTHGGRRTYWQRSGRLPDTARGSKPSTSSNSATPHV